MQLEIPDGARVHITIGGPLLLASPPDTVANQTPAKLNRPLLTGIAVVAVLFVGFQFWRNGPGHGGAMQAASMAQATERPPSTTEVPPGFRQRLDLPAQVTPPPGQMTGAAADKSVNAFGLHE